MAADTTLTATTVTFGSDVGLGVRQLSVVGNAAFSASGTLAVAASGASGGDYGQVAVSGSVSLGGADLDLSVSYAARPGDALTIINDPSGVVSGTFAGLADGSTVTVQGIQWRIHYGSSAVTLTAISSRRASRSPPLRRHRRSTAAPTRRRLPEEGPAIRWCSASTPPAPAAAWPGERSASPGWVPA